LLVAGFLDVLLHAIVPATALAVGVIGYLAVGVDR